MAVYTHLGAENVEALLRRYDVGQLRALKGIAEGVENSNFYVETTGGRFILTLYENRVDPKDLPFFHDLLAHLHRAGCKVPRFIEDSDGHWLQSVAGRPACLIEFLEGVSVSRPTAAQARATGAALGEMHAALLSFSGERQNSLGMRAWRPLADKCGEDALEGIQPGLARYVFAQCDDLEAAWPTDLPRSAIHADLFPDNVLILNDRVTGLIDFYFACTDIRGFDLAVTHSAWCFSPDGQDYDAEVSTSLLAGYASTHTLDVPTRDSMSVLLRGACLRFLLTRCYDWINTPPGALVTRKDPLAFRRRLDFYRDGHNIDTIMGQIN